MHPETSNNVNISSNEFLFVEDSLCFYEFSVDENSLDTWVNEYKWKISFEKLKNVDVVFGFGLSLSEATLISNVQTNKDYESTKIGNNLYFSFTGKNYLAEYKFNISVITTIIPERDRAPRTDEVDKDIINTTNIVVN